MLVGLYIQTKKFDTPNFFKLKEIGSRLNLLEQLDRKNRPNVIERPANDRRTLISMIMAYIQDVTPSAADSHEIQSLTYILL